MYSSFKYVIIQRLKTLYKPYIDKRETSAATIIPVQRQNDGNSHGLFAIASGADNLCEDSPENSTFDLSQMQNHLLTCLENVEVTKFLRNLEKQRLLVKRQAYRVVLV